MLPSLADTPSAEVEKPFFILVAALLSWFKLAATGQVSALPATCISHLQKDYGLSPSSPKESLQQQTSSLYLSFPPTFHHSSLLNSVYLLNSCTFFGLWVFLLYIDLVNK